MKNKITEEQARKLLDTANNKISKDIIENKNTLSELFFFECDKIIELLQASQEVFEAMKNDIIKEGKVQGLIEHSTQEKITDLVKRTEPVIISNNGKNYIPEENFNELKELTYDFMKDEKI